MCTHVVKGKGEYLTGPDGYSVCFDSPEHAKAILRNLGGEFSEEEIESYSYPECNDPGCQGR